MSSRSLAGSTLPAVWKVISIFRTARISAGLPVSCVGAANTGRQQASSTRMSDLFTGLPFALATARWRTCNDCLTVDALAARKPSGVRGMENADRTETAVARSARCRGHGFPGQTIAVPLRWRESCRRQRALDDAADKAPASTCATGSARAGRELNQVRNGPSSYLTG